MIFEFNYVIIIIIIISAFLLYYNRTVFIDNNTKIVLLNNQETILTQDYEVKYNLQEINQRIFKCNNHINLTFSIYPFSIENNVGWKSQYDSNKPIIMFETSPTIHYNVVKSIIIIAVKYNDPAKDEYSIYETDFPILQQKWSIITISIVDTYIKIYVNGVVFKIAKVPYMPIYSSSGNFIIGQKNNNFQGKLKNIVLL